MCESTQASDVPIDATDNNAARILKRLVERQRKASPDIPVKQILQSFALNIKWHHQWKSVFRNDERGLTMDRIPARWPDVPTNELRRAEEECGEDGAALSSFALVDVDGDGQRDIIIERYVSGTGLLDQDSISTESFVNVFLRKGKHYSRVPHPNLDEIFENKDLTPYYYYLYGSQWERRMRAAHWVKLLGRVYTVIEEEPEDGVDRITILRPAKLPSKIAEWTVPFGRHQAPR